MDSLDVIKSIGYILVLVLVFSPLTFLVAGTFVEGGENRCYDEFPYVQKMNATEEEQMAQNQKRVDCQYQYEEQETREKTIVFIVVSVLSIITLLVLVFMKNIASIIIYGLFFGVSINIIRLVWGFTDANSTLSVGFGIILFLLAVVFINKNLNQDKSIKKKKK